MGKYRKVLSSSTEIREVPGYIRVLPLGYVTSEKGDFIVDEECFKLMNAHMQRRAIDIVIDYEHQTLEGVQAPASGWIKELSLKTDGIYAKVEWTAKAKVFLANKEYRYLSPVILVRESDKKAVILHSVALTNTPAISGMTPIVNSDKDLESEYEFSRTEKNILRMLNITEQDFLTYGFR